MGGELGLMAANPQVRVFSKGLWNADVRINCGRVSRGKFFPSVSDWSTSRRRWAAGGAHSGAMTSLEIVTGKRRVIQYLWSPVARAVREAGREK